MYIHQQSLPPGPAGGVSRSLFMRERGKREERAGGEEGGREAEAGRISPE